MGTEQETHSPDEMPSPARMYDYYLGGHHNFPADRAAAERVIALAPSTPLIAQANRAFLRRVVTFLLEQGIDQFLDLGSGIPTAGNVHEVAQEASPGARVVYVDSDPLAVTHSAAILGGNPTAAVIRADARQPETILAHPEVRRLLDMTRPLGVLMVGFLYFIVDDGEAARLVGGLRDAVAPGSYIAISHAIDDLAPSTPQEVIEGTAEVYRRSTNPVAVRSRAGVARFFTGLDLVEPGLVDLPLWRPEGPDDLFLEAPEQSTFVAGVGRKPAR